jgi:branched-chain amino acid transport system substrate-binding protein
MVVRRRSCLNFRIVRVDAGLSILPGGGSGIAFRQTAREDPVEGRNNAREESAMKRRALGLLALAAGAVRATAPARAADVLTIGAIGPLTGAGSAWGTAVAAGPQLAAAEINGQGGLKVGDKSYEVKVLAYDEQYTAAGAVAAYTRLVTQDGVKYIMGPLSSAGAVAIKDMVEENRTIIFIGGTTRKAIDANTKFLFRPYSTVVEYGGPVVRWLRDRQPEGRRRVVLLDPNDETGWAGQAAEQAAYAGNGFQVVASELYERSLKDFQPVLTKLLAQKPDVVELGTSVGSTAGLIVRQARERGFTGRFVKIGGPAPRDIVAGAGKEAAEGVLNYMIADEKNPGYARLAATFKKERGFEPAQNFILFYDATRVLFAAMQQAGTVTDSDKVRQAIAQVMPFRATMGGTITLSGKATYGAETQFVTVSYVGEIHNGEPVALGAVE